MSSFRWYLARRLAWTALATYIIVSITFVMLWASPNTGIGDLAFQAAQRGADPSQVIESQRTRLGLNEPVWQQYITYMSNIFTLNWGWSESLGRPVIDLLADKVRYTAIYAVPTTIFSTIVGVSIGLYSAANQYTRFDYAATFFAFFGFAIPNFWFGILLLVFFGAYLGWVPIVFDLDAGLLSFQMAKQLILPVFVLATGQLASLMLYTRAESLEYVQAEFTKVAKAKGVSETRVLTRHIFRPALVPLSTLLVTDLLGIFIAASVLIEVVFSIPGLGRLTLAAINNQDTSLVLATTLVFVFISVFGNLLQDIAYTVLDPRIDYGDR